MTPPADPARYKNHRFPGEIISHGVWLYYRFPLSYRDVEELLLERGIDVTHEAIRQWCLKFGQDYANQLKRRRAQRGDKWHLEIVFGRGCNVASALHRVSDRAGKETRAVRLWPQETRGVGCACGWGWRRSPSGVAGPPCLAGVSPGGAGGAGAGRRGDQAPASGPGRAWGSTPCTRRGGALWKRWSIARA